MAGFRYSVAQIIVLDQADDVFGQSLRIPHGAYQCGSVVLATYGVASDVGAGDGATAHHGFGWRQAEALAVARPDKDSRLVVDSVVRLLVGTLPVAVPLGKRFRSRRCAEDVDYQLWKSLFDDFQRSESIGASLSFERMIQHADAIFVFFFDFD